jgi:heavy metal sensor kinase
MIFNSIRARLQIWYGLILVVILAGFGFTAYELERGHLLGRINGELGRRANFLANALHRHPGGPDRGGPAGERPPLGQFPDDGPPQDQAGPPPNLRLPPEAAGLFDASDPNNFFFIVRSHDGQIVQQSTNAPSLADLGNDAFPRAAPAAGQPPREMGRENPPRFEIKGDRVVSRLVTPMGGLILVGGSIGPELKELRVFAVKLTLVGAAILLLGLTGGWWLASRAIRPINDISATAAKISAGDLSQRISLAETESELGRLAAVLNSTFARLEAAFAQQQQFTSDAAHELRTPVTVMLTQTQLSLSRERGADEYRQTIEACQRAAQRMRRLTESLLALARLDAGQEPMRRLPVDLASLVRECAEMVQPLAADRGVALTVEAQPGECLGDSDRLAQVVTNLITNAIQYNRPSGEVRVTAARDNAEAVITVRDTGVGIPAEDRPRVFERFYRSDKSRTAGGHGLGLAICQAIITAHGGSIAVASEVGVGTTFTIRLPVG